MQCYARYIMRHIVVTGFVVTAALTGIVWLAQTLRFIDFIVNRGVSLSTFLELTLLLIPSLLVILLPVSLLIAVVITYYRLNQDSELVVLHAAGLGPWRIARPALVVAVAITLLGYALALYLQPLSRQQFKDMQSFLRDRYASVLLQEEVFSSPVEGVTVFIRERGKDGTLKGILVHDSREEAHPVTMMAAMGKLMRDTDGTPRFLLERGNRQEMRNGRLSVLHFERYLLDLGFYSGVTGMRERDPGERTIDDLWQASSDATAKQFPQLRAEVHQRLTWPAYALSLTLLALAFLFTGQFSRRGQWRRVLVLAGAAVGVTLAAFSLPGITTRFEAAIPLMYALPLLVALASAHALSGGRLHLKGQIQTEGARA